MGTFHRTARTADEMGDSGTFSEISESVPGVGGWE